MTEKHSAWQPSFQPYQNLVRCVRHVGLFFQEALVVLHQQHGVNLHVIIVLNLAVMKLFQVPYISPFYLTIIFKNFSDFFKYPYHTP